MLDTARRETSSNSWNSRVIRDDCFSACDVDARVSPTSDDHFSSPCGGSASGYFARSACHILTSSGWLLAVDGSQSLTTTVNDDGEADVLTSSAGQDWCLLNADVDDSARKGRVTELSAAEFADDLNSPG